MKAARWPPCWTRWTSHCWTTPTATTSSNWPPWTSTSVTTSGCAPGTGREGRTPVTWDQAPPVLTELLISYLAGWLWWTALSGGKGGGGVSLGPGRHHLLGAKQLRGEVQAGGLHQGALLHPVDRGEDQGALLRVEQTDLRQQRKDWSASNLNIILVISINYYLHHIYQLLLSSLMNISVNLCFVLLQLSYFFTGQLLRQFRQVVPFFPCSHFLLHSSVPSLQ